MALKMREYALLHYGAFEDDRAACAAANDCSKNGIEIVDVYGPYPIHGIDKAMGLKPSRLTWACFLFGLTSLICALLLQYWTSAFDWPTNVGGKPYESLPAFIPVAFEMTVLFAGLGTVGTFLVWARLFPGKRAILTKARVNDDRFVIVVRGGMPVADQSKLEELWKQHGAAESWAEHQEIKS
ncbi:MAG: DUF3341 domain-containing protein [Planctomycetota bacterium]